MSYRESGLAGIPISEPMLFAAGEATRHGYTEISEIEDEGGENTWLEWVRNEAKPEMAQDGVIE